MEVQKERCKVIQIRVNLSDGTPSAKAVRSDVERVMKRMIKCVEKRAETWEDYDYAVLEAREELVQMQKSLGADATAFPLQFGKQAPAQSSRKRAGARVKSSNKRKNKQKHKQQPVEKQSTKEITSQEQKDLHLQQSSFQVGDVVMAWMTTMYYPAQVLAVSSSGNDEHGVMFEIRLLGWEPEQRITIPASWALPVPEEYASSVNLSSLLRSAEGGASASGVLSAADQKEHEHEHEEEASQPQELEEDRETKEAEEEEEEAVNGEEEAEKEKEDGEAEEEDDPKPSADIPDKYWDQRYRFFSRFDHGIELDLEGWYSVTPEMLALYIAHRCAGQDVIDLFAGVGGNVIAFARMCTRICACDINEHRLQLAQSNARVYGVADKIEWRCVNSIELLRRPDSIVREFSVCLLSPPWGGPAYLERPVYRLEDIRLPHGDEVVDGFELLRLALEACPNAIYLLPRSTSLKDIKLAGQKNGARFCLVEDLCLHGKCKMRVAYFGPLFVRQEPCVKHDSDAC